MPTLLWEPPAEMIERAVMTRYMREHGHTTYDELWRWSVDDLSTMRLNVFIGFPLGGVLSLAIAGCTSVVFGPLDASVDTLGQVGLPVAVALGKLGLAFAILGFVACHVIPRFEHGDSIVRILALVVDAGARERGVGRQLIGDVERIAASRGAAFVELTAGHHRPDARHLYESLGYDATVAAYLRKKL